MRFQSVLLVPALALAALAGGPAVDVTRLYQGAVAGNVTVAFDGLGGQTVTSDVAEKSNVMGKARQVFTAVDVSQLPYQTSGLITSVNRQGDELHLSFTLYTVAQLSPFEVQFVGEYHVLGGTGRFDFVGPTLTGDYGSGTITGTAVIDPTVPGQLGLSFRDEFRGTLAVQAAN